MTVQTTITSGIDAERQRLVALVGAISTEENAIIGQLAADIRRLEQSIMHVQTGRMRTSTYVEGPFSVGQGALEWQIGPHVSYAADEMARGGSHDFKAQTLADAQALIDAAVARLQQRIVELLG